MIMSKQYFYFDKFVQDLEERDHKQREYAEELKQQEESWTARELDRRYREHHLNCIVVRERNGNKSK
jgi:hypothetical protein